VEKVVALPAASREGQEYAPVVARRVPRTAGII